MEAIGSYELDLAAVLGHGASAIVYKGRHIQRPSENVAIKKVEKKIISRLSHVLSKEISMLTELKSVKHRNIVSLLDYQETCDHVYLITEYCNGGDLSKYINDFSPLKENVIAHFLRQIASAMMVLHSKGIIHRDLKPQNILISKTEHERNNPFGFILKIADFGFARFLEDGVMAATMCGSPLYMAPEVLLSSKYDRKADLWSVGAIVYQCLTGRPPFLAKTPELLKQHYRCNPDMPPRFPSGASVSVKGLLLGLLVHDPCRRMDYEDFFQHEFLTPTPDMDKFMVRRLESVPLRMSSAIQHDRPVRHTNSNKEMATHVRETKLREKEMKTIHEFQQQQQPCLKTSLPRPASLCSDDFVFVTKPDDPNDDDDWEIPSNDVIPKVNTPSKPLTLNTRKPSTSSNPVNIPLRERMLRHLVTDCDVQKTLSSPEFQQSATNSAVKESPASGSPKVTRQSSLARLASAESISPPSVQFTIGTPSSTSSRSNSPAVLTPSSSALPFQHQASQSNLPRYFTPSGSSYTSDSPSFATSPMFFVEMESSISFVAPELDERPFLDKVEIELIERFEFIRDLCKCIMLLARARGSVLSESLLLGRALPTRCSKSLTIVNEKQRRIEQLQLYMYVLQLLTSVLQLAQEMLKERNMSPSKCLILVISDINDIYQQCLTECKSAKQKGTPTLVSNSLPNPPDNKIHMTERLLFCCAIDLLQSGMSEDVVGNTHDCLSSYHSAYLLLHSLARQALKNDDQHLLDNYRDCIERRMKSLHKKGFTCIKN